LAGRAEGEPDADLFFAQRDFVGKQAVGAEDGEEESERAEGGGYLHEEGAKLDFGGHLLIHSAEVEEREIGVLGANDVAYGPDEQGGIAAGADHEDHGGLGMVGFGKVEVGARGGFEIVTVDITNDTDDGGPLLDVAGFDAVADGGFPRPFALGKGLVDDDDVALAVVCAGEAAACEESL